MCTAVLAVLVVAGCTARSGPSQAPASTPRKPVVVAPLEVPAAPVWTTEDTGLHRGRAENVGLHENTVLLSSDEMIQVVDAPTGAVRWSRLGTADLGGGAIWHSNGSPPRLVGAGNELAVLTEYIRPSATGVAMEYGLVLLSAADGHVLRLTPVGEVNLATGPGAQLRAADHRVALVTFVPGREAHEVNRLEDLRVLAIDVRTGVRLWERTGVWPTMIAGDTLVGTDARSHDPTPWDDEPEAGHVVTFDLMTGTPRWDLKDRYDAARPLVAADDVVAVHAEGRDGPVLVLLSAATGDEIAALASPDGGRCLTDQVAAIACRTRDNHVDVFRLSDRKVITAEGDITAVWRDRAVIPRDAPTYAVDMSAADDLPDRPLAVSNDYLITGDGPPDTTGPSVMTAYRLTP